MIKIPAFAGMTNLTGFSEILKLALYLLVGITSKRGDRLMSRKGRVQNVFQRTGREGMTPSEVMIYNLRKRCRVNADVLKEIVAEVSSSPSDSADPFEQCLAALRRRGLVVF